MTIYNCTPHALNICGNVFEPCGLVPRVADSWTVEPGVESLPAFSKAAGRMTWIGEAPEGLDDYDVLIVSAMVLESQRLPGASKVFAEVAGFSVQLVAPATGHPGVIRNEKGHIVSVPGVVL